MGFTWTSIAQGDTIDAHHFNEMSHKLGTLYQDLQLSPPTWSNLPVADDDEIKQAILPEVREKTDNADDQNYCREDDAAYDSGVDGTDDSGYDSDYDSGVDNDDNGTYDSGEDGTYDATADDTYNSGDDTSIYGSDYGTYCGAEYAQANDPDNGSFT